MCLIQHFLKSGIKCGILLTRIVTLLIVLGSCSLRDNSIIMTYQCFNTSTHQECQLRPIAFIKLNKKFLLDSNVALVEKDSGIFLVNSDNRDKLLYSFEDLNTAVMSKTGVGFPFPKADTKLVGVESFNNVKVYKFQQDQLAGSHRIVFSYYVKSIGFILFIDYFGDTYWRLDNGKAQMDVKVDSVVSEVIKDSLFFQYPVLLVPPTVPD